MIKSEVIQMNSKLIIGLLILFVLIISTLLFAAKNSDSITEVFQKAVSSKGIKTVSIVNTNGDVEIASKKSGDIEITATKKVFYRDREKAEDFLDEIKINVSTSATTLQIRTIPPEDDNWYKFYQKKVTGYRVEYKIVMPEDLQGEIENKYGDVSVVNIKSILSNNHSGNTFVESINGDADLTNSYGKVNISFIEGDLISKNKSGNTTVKEIKGTVDIKNTYGNIKLNKAGKNAIIENKSGNVDATFIEQSLEVSNSYGSVYVDEVDKELKVYSKSGAVEAINIGGNADLATSYDGIQCQNIGGSLKVVNKSGTVTAEFISGRADIETSYNAVKAIDVSGPVTVLNKSGSVYLEKIKGDVNIESSYDTVELFEITGSAEINSSSGKIIARDISGDFRGTTSYNAVTLDNVQGTIRVKNKSGKITVSGKPVSLDLSTTYSGIELLDVTCKTITAITRSGGIDADVTLSANCDCRFETSYGDIDLTIPASTSTKISAIVPKGNRIRLSRGLTITTTQLSKETIEGKIGKGEGIIELLVERSGNISLSGK
jgi:hypothetical protein